MARKKGSSGGFGMGLVLGLVLAAAGALAYFKFGMAPARTPDKPTPFERSAPTDPPPPVVRPEHRVKTSPFGTSEDVFEAGARIYKMRCASCHGNPGRDAVVSKSVHPAARQLFKRQGGATGVSALETGVIYEKIASGILQSGMPAYESQLSETQMWQVSLLLKNAGQQLPDPVVGILNRSK